MRKATKAPVAVRRRPTTAPKRRRPKEVRERIIQAAIKAFAKHGFVGARVRSIAEDAGITIQLLTHHVKSKDNLWKVVVEELKVRYGGFRSSHPPLPPNASAKEKLQVMIADVVHFTASVPELHRMVIMESGGLNARMFSLVEAFARKPFEEMCQLISEAQRDGAIKKLNPGRLRYAITAMAAVPFSVAAEYETLTGKDPFSNTEIERNIEMINALVFNK